MTTIFLSHSKHDSNIIDVFRKSFQNTNVSPMLMEFEQFSNPPWLDIKHNIESSSALFVLLSNNLKISDYTQNWVSYEIGIAVEANKQVWVFEDVNNQILFPIPQVHHYVRYDSSQIESLNYLQTIIRSYGLNARGALGLGLLSLLAFSNPAIALAGTLIGSKINVPPQPVGSTIECNYQNCKVSFQYHNLDENILCPSCRQPLTIQFDSDSVNNL